jgi:HD-GYP domain-containing protein (c-di-GMP phosphodiesterase class II)
MLVNLTACRHKNYQLSSGLCDYSALARVNRVKQTEVHQTMTEHRDSLDTLNRSLPLQEKLIAAHDSVQDMFPFIVRIAIALYDHKSETLSTYLHSSGADNPLDHYQASMADAPSLRAILDKGLPRVVNDQLTFEDGEHEHTARIGRAGYVASYTMPMFNEGQFVGFIFFNSNERGVFSEKVLQEIDLYGHLISLLVINELAAVNTLSAAVRTTGKLTHLRDPETGSHLDRMSRYSRLIARQLAEKHQLSDSFVEHVFMFSPLHDIGKIGIPDSILLKPGKLDEDELVVMRTHALKGEEIINDLISNFGLENFEYREVLRNIAACHHEAYNGAGYPSGLKGEDIPLEARIVAVADVFDALTSRRPYKEAWSNETAIATLQELAGESLDQDCVEALVNSLSEVEEIQRHFSEDSTG